ncbi:MAG: rhomboid family intramembrane serine protease [Lysobacterales bacterium]|jgi:membrane associated rhomboid family serine protease|nr:MAG: rhomboid family intramembrane serine protease [Xanthomonadales bacterium]
MMFDATSLLVLSTLAFSLLAWQSPALLEAAIFSMRRLHQGQWWRVLSYGFVHADAAHLLFNLLALYSFGRALEPVFDRTFPLGGFAGFYLSALPLAVLPVLIGRWQVAEYRSLGASGAVSAVIFAYVLLDPRGLLLVFLVPMPAFLFAVLFLAYSVWAANARRDRIAHEVHLAGAAYGLACAALFVPNALSGFLDRLLGPSPGNHIVCVGRSEVSSPARIDSILVFTASPSGVSLN